MRKTEKNSIIGIRTNMQIGTGYLCEDIHDLRTWNNDVRVPALGG